MTGLSKVTAIPLDRGHYEMDSNVFEQDIDRDSVPLGFYHGYNTIMDNKKQIRCRPYTQSCLEKTSLTGITYTPRAAIYLYGSYLLIAENTPLKYTTGSESSWTTVSGGQTYTPTNLLYGIGVGYYFDMASGSNAHWAVVGVRNCYASLVKMNSSGGIPTAVDIGSNAHHKGIAAVDENRIQLTQRKKIYYSTREDGATGYDISGSGEMYYIDNLKDHIVFWESDGANFYVVCESLVHEQIRIYKKATTYEDDTPLDGTQFVQVASSDGRLPTWGDSCCMMNGALYLWIQSKGLCVLTDAGLLSVNAPITGDNVNMIKDYHDVLLIPIPYYNSVMVVDDTANIIHVYDAGLGIWNRWSHTELNVSGKGYGRPGMFVTSDETVPVEFGPLPTPDDTSVSIAPYIYTPGLNFDYPFHWKKIESILFNARGITDVAVYTRMNMREDYTLWKNISVSSVGNGSSPAKLNLTDPVPFRDCVIAITGDRSFRLKDLAVKYEVGEEIDE